MAQPRSVAPAPALRVSVIAPAGLGATAIAALAARGIPASLAPSDAAAAIDGGDDVVACALDVAPSPAAAIELAASCARAVIGGRPVCVLAPPATGSGRAAVERAAALAYVRAHGAAITHDVDAWLEAVVLLVRFGLPAGPRAAVVAPPGSWLEAQTRTVLADPELASARAAAVDPATGALPADAVLFDARDAAATSEVATRALRVPVAPRGELLLIDGAPALIGMREAFAAVTMLGRAAERIAAGLGPASRKASAELERDEALFARSLAKLRGMRRIGDHETKALLAAYGVPITRQAVATTPSAAVKLAKRAGFPVELKPWGSDLPSEPAGCPVERDVTSAALVRRAFSAVLAAAGRSGAAAEDSGVIVRAAPPPGRDLSVSIVKLPAVGWTVVLEPPGAAQIAAAPAPLRLLDAQTLAAQVVASRAGEPELDRAGLANLLRRASHLAVDLPGLVRLDLPRVVVGGRGARTLVVDASAELD